MELFADQWNVQATIQRLNESLIARGYVTWFDLTNMKGQLTQPQSLLIVQSVSSVSTSGVFSCGVCTGSTMDAMSDAIEGADVMLYGVSLAYKESANVSASSCPAVWCDACSRWLGFLVYLDGL